MTKQDLQGAYEKNVTMTVKELLEVGQGVMDAMNDTVKKGHNIDQVLFAASYVLGIAFAQRGAVLSFDEPLKNALSPLYEGYLAATREKAQS